LVDGIRHYFIAHLAILFVGPLQGEMERRRSVAARHDGLPRAIPPGRVRPGGAHVPGHGVPGAVGRRPAPRPRRHDGATHARRRGRRHGVRGAVCAATFRRARRLPRTRRRCRRRRGRWRVQGKCWPFPHLAACSLLIHVTSVFVHVCC
jgi:hypothetical protein